LTTIDAAARAAARSGFRPRELGGFPITPLACLVRELREGDVLHARAIRAAIDGGINLFVVAEPSSFAMLAKLVDPDERAGLVIASPHASPDVDVMLAPEMLVDFELAELATALRSIDAATGVVIATCPVERDSDPRTGNALAQVRKLEAAWATDLGARIRTGDGDATDLFRWSRALERFVAEGGGADAWQRLRHDVIAPHVGRASAALLAHLSGDDRESFATWWQRYGTALHHAFVAIESATSDPPPQLRIAAAIDPILPAALRALPLPCRALGIALSAPVCAAAVDLRSPADVAQLAALAQIPHDPGAVDLAAVARRVAAD
jgi:hypothetical protein